MKSARVLPALWGLAALLGAFTLYRFVDFVRGKDKYLTPLGERQIRDPLREKGPDVRARVAKNWDDYKNLYDLLITGKEKPRAPTGMVGPPPPPVRETQPVSDLLRVLYVSFDEEDPTGTRPFNLEDFRGHYCFVQYKDPALEKAAEPLLSVGVRLPDPHPDVQVKAIFTDHVVFTQKGTDEELPVHEYEIAAELVQGVLSGGDAASRPSSRPGGPRLSIPAPKGWPEKTTEVKPNQWRVSAEDLDTFSTRGNEIVGTEITVTPYYPKGATRPSGLRIGAIKPGSILEGKGVKSGDILLSINGTSIRSKEQVFEYAQDHPELRTFTVELERLGKPYTLQYSIPH